MKKLIIAELVKAKEKRIVLEQVPILYQKESEKKK